MSPLHSYSSGKKEDNLKRESRELNDSEDEGDLLEDDEHELKGRGGDEEDEHEEGEDDGDSANGDES